MPDRDTTQWREINRLYRGIKRDYFRAVEWGAGIRGASDPSGRRGAAASRRLARNWEALCNLDDEVAAALARSFFEFATAMQSEQEVRRRIDEETSKG